MKTVRLVLYFVLGLLLGGCFTLSYAGTFQSYQGSAFRNINGTTYWKGDATSFAASKATVIESIKVGGTYITVPTFGQVTGAALSAVRMTPGLAGAALISWLASRGLEYLDGQWKKPDNSTQAPSELGQCSSAGLSPQAAALMPTGTGQSATDCMNAAMSAMNSTTGYWYVKDPHMSCTPGSCTFSYQFYSPQDSYTWRAQNISGWSRVATQCPDGWVLEGSICRSNGYTPAGDSDWDQVLGIQPPAEVMADLCRRLANLGSGCEVTAAGTLKASASLSDWAPNPATGKDERQVATWTPRPSSQDPFAGEVSVNTESKDPLAPTDPATGNTTNPGDTTTQDNTKDTPFCTLYPESLACAKMGTPEDAGNLESKSMGVESITIQTFGSSATCPAPIPLPHGSELSFEWPCRMAEGVKPFLLALAWLAAGLIVIGAMRND